MFLLLKINKFLNKLPLPDFLFERIFFLLLVAVGFSKVALD